MRSRTSFAFCGLVRWNFASARNSRIFSAATLAMIFVLQNFCFAAPCGGLAVIHAAKNGPELPGLRGGLSCLGRVALERARRRELAELVAHHVLRHVDRDELAAVVNCNGMADEVRGNGRAARPGAANLLIVRLVHNVDLRHEVTVDRGTFFS